MQANICVVLWWCHFVHYVVEGLFKCRFGWNYSCSSLQKNPNSKHTMCSRGLIFSLTLEVDYAAWLGASPLWTPPVTTVTISVTQRKHSGLIFLKNHRNRRSIDLAADKWYQWLLMQKYYPYGGWSEQTGPPAWFNLLCGIPRRAGGCLWNVALWRAQWPRLAVRRRRARCLNWLQTGS